MALVEDVATHTWQLIFLSFSMLREEGGRARKRGVVVFDNISGGGFVDGEEGIVGRGLSTAVKSISASPSSKSKVNAGE
jgi:hypothetical protein